ncbi:hypothetical protein O181_106774 [Austropuccinia psidii MF-1]|uniref:Uncharacterized protein n=1 Tax=Austropuccinia psidii MF-1 TaxID=1389203 RepID=A0A9Q3JRZ6_9BASI|nr:hypothetical protein [Austropuccinia psidii MF-1]
MDYGQQEVQPRFKLGRTWSRLPEDMSQRDTLQRYNGNNQLIESQQTIQTPQGKAPAHQLPRVTLLCNPWYFPGEDKDPKGKQGFFQPEAERVRPHDTEAIFIRERISQEPEIVVNTSDRIRSPATRNITPTQNEHSSVTPESNINSNELWLKMSQF